MKLIPVARLPKGAVKDGEPISVGDHGSIAQDYRHNEDLYEYVTRQDGVVRIFKVVNCLE